MDEETLAASASVDFSYKPDGLTAVVTVAGQEIQGFLRRVTIDHGPAAFPKVFLELRSGVELDAIECKAVVSVVKEVLEDPLEAVQRFLEPLDPGEFEKACLAAMEMGGPATFGEAALYVLKEWTKT